VQLKHSGFFFFFSRANIYVVTSNKSKPSAIVPADGVCRIKHNIFTPNNPVKSYCFLQILFTLQNTMESIQNNQTGEQKTCIQMTYI